MNDSSPVIVAVAPNGARHQKTDHAEVPLNPRELADTAVACAEAGAAMIHVHVRDEDGQHSLEPVHYEPAIDAIKAAVGSRMLIQVTSEAAGIYAPDYQMRSIGALAPDGVSIAVRELFVDEITTERAARFLATIGEAGTLVQYILYEPGDVERYRHLVAKGAIPSVGHWVLFVLGRYGESGPAPHRLDDFLVALEGEAQWMACAFGNGAFDTLGEAADRGGHVRIGFENGWLMPDGRVAPDNAALVTELVSRLRTAGHEIATAADARALYERD